jgi:glycosyltransferase involved in cell wall biosynthesis
VSPRVDIYAFCWNEERFLPYFFRHYLTFAQHIYVADNESTDRSLEIIRSFPRTSFITSSTNNEFRDETQMAFKNDVWKSKRQNADWIMCVDIDEIVWHPEMLKFLQQCDEEDVAVVKPRGFQMVSETFPTTTGQVYEEVNRGVASELYSKPVVFSPRRIEEMNYRAGAHGADPAGTGKILMGSPAMLLHYHYLGWIISGRAMRKRESGWGR